LKENKKATKKIDAPVIAFGAELIKDKEGELSWSVDGTRVASGHRWLQRRESGVFERKKNEAKKTKPLTR
jgi:hypothetical protein